jgi:hypothetical protein
LVKPIEANRKAPDFSERREAASLAQGWERDLLRAPNWQSVAAEIRISGEAVEVGAVQPLPVAAMSSGGYAYDVSSDGHRMLCHSTNGPKPSDLSG